MTNIAISLTLWRRKPLFYWLLLLIIAAATPLTFAPYYQFWLMPILFALLVAIIESRPQYAVRSVYLFGLISYTCQFYWIHTALHDVSGLPNLYAIPLTFLLPAFLALYPAATFWLWRKFTLPRWLNIGFVLPILWTLTEFAREQLLTGFGWGALGYSQVSDLSPLAGFAPLGGIHLVTFTTALIGTWLLLLISAHNIKQRISAIGIIAALLLSGWLLRNISFTIADGSRATVALIQGNIEQTIKWDNEQIAPTIQHYYNQVATTHADIVILPETAIPVMRQSLPPGLINQFADEANRNGSALAIGIVQFADDFSGYENVVINLAGYQSGDEKIPYYAKNHLVPFGEYKPLPMITEPLYQLMNMPLADFHRGSAAQRPFHMANQKIAFNICYEDGFGDELIASAKEASLLANISNMAWYGHSNAMFQQLQQSQARALELGRYMVRATNTGMTTIINPKGNIIAQIKPNIAATLEGTIEGYKGLTPYMRTGSSWPLMILLSLTSLILYLIGRKKFNP